ncbi:hypothetical protein GGI07_003216 [Coemansia sp. Benny D115]|nr:hypothetical protein GGI07_003216 [Coemansia sp. Benny D115]
MANIAATFTSGLVLGGGAVYAFTSYFTEQSHIMNYKLRRASLLLKEASTGELQVLPTWKDAKPDIMNKYQKLVSRVSENAIPLAKTEWNSTIALVADRVSGIDVDADKISSLVLKDNRA